MFFHMILPCFKHFLKVAPTNILLFKVNDFYRLKNMRNMFKINNSGTNDVVLVFLLLILNINNTFFLCLIVDFEKVNTNGSFFKAL